MVDLRVFMRCESKCFQDFDFFPLVLRAIQMSRAEVAESGGTDNERVGRTVLTDQHQRRNLEASKTTSPKLRLAADGEDVRRGIVCT